MKNLIDLALDSVTRWHTSRETYYFFDKVELPRTQPEKTVVELAYFDYNGWHMQEEFPEAASEAQRANKNRCELMDKFDGWYETQLKPDSADRNFMVPNTETMGSVLDRIVNHQIKLLHVEARHALSQQLEPQLDWLIQAAIQLNEDCRAGRRYVTPFSRWKVGYP